MDEGRRGVAQKKRHQVVFMQFFELLTRTKITIFNLSGLIFSVLILTLPIFAADKKAVDVTKFGALGDVMMDGVIVPISIRLGARLKTFREGDTPKPTAGKIRSITIQNVKAKNIEMIGMLINGVPGHPIEDLTLKNIE